MKSSNQFGFENKPPILQNDQGGSRLEKINHKDQIVLIPAILSSVEILLEKSALSQSNKAKIIELSADLRNVIGGIKERGDLYTVTDLIDLESLKYGVEEVLENIDESDDVDTQMIRRLLVGAKEKLEYAPLPVMDLTAEAGIDVLKKLLEEGSSRSYEKITRSAGETVRRVVEQKVGSLLEIASGIIPLLRREEIRDRAKKLSGKVAFGFTVVSVGMLALGASAKNAHAEVVLESGEEGGMSLTHLETGQKIDFVTLDDMPNETTRRGASDLFEKIRDFNIELAGVNYTIENPDLFFDQIKQDAGVFARNLFGKDLKEVTPSEFVKVVNAMVQDKLEYDHLALEKTVSGEAENIKISGMPLDVIYMTYGKGVCRHYSALVEKIGETIIERGLTPNCRGVAIDEISGEDQNHAWNVYYANAKQSEGTIRVSYTDATWDDNTQTFFDGLEAREGGHPSVVSNLENLNMFSRDEQLKIYQNLSGVGEGWERRAASRILAQEYLAEYNGINIPDRYKDSNALDLLVGAISHSRESGIGAPERIGAISREVYLSAVSSLISFYRNAGNLKEALPYLEQAVIETASVPELNDRILTEYVINAKQMPGGIDNIKPELVEALVLVVSETDPESLATVALTTMSVMSEKGEFSRMENILERLEAKISPDTNNGKTLSEIRHRLENRP